MPFEQLGPDRETPERPAVALLYSQTQNAMVFTVLEIMFFVLFFFFFFKFTFPLRFLNKITQETSS